MKNNELVFVKRSEPVTNSLIVAKEIQYDHWKVTRLIEKHKQDFEDFGLINFQSCLVNERSAKVYNLNRGQFLLLVSYLRTTKKSTKVNELKKSMVKAFETMADLLAEQQTEGYKEARLIGKTFRRSFTDAIKAYVTYCEESGSKNARKYYTTLTSMINKAVGCTDRDKANKSQIAQLAFIEDRLADLIYLHLGNRTEYHEIFVDCKARTNAIMAVSSMKLLT